MLSAQRRKPFVGSRFHFGSYFLDKVSEQVGVGRGSLGNEKYETQQLNVTSRLTPIRSASKATVWYQ
jgi:hypothetical protein